MSDIETRTIDIIRRLSGSAMLPHRSMELSALDVDSLDRVEIAMAIEEAFGVEVPDEALETWVTVDDVVRLAERLAR